jgi:hypothetical protein
MGQGESRLSLEEGTELVKLARKAISYSISSQHEYSSLAPSEKFEEKRGVFVTLHTWPDNALRGCIGFARPLVGLWKATIQAATLAAFHDPRFPPLQAQELDRVTIEVSVLTKPEEVEKEKLLESVKIGRDGLIVERGRMSGLLLPQVATEFGFDVETFVRETCRKAGLPSAAWMLSDTKVYRFQAQIFKEESPGGKIVEVKHSKCR